MKYCTRCGKPFEAVGREVICPACREAAAEATKRAAVERAKLASWNGESVPVRISGRASTVIRAYGAKNGLPFAAALDALLKASTFFQSAGKAWESVEPYKSRRRSKSTTETAQEVPQEAPQASKPQASKPQASKPQEVPQEVKAAGKPQEVKQAAKTTNKTSTAKKADKAAGKATAASKKK